MRLAIKSILVLTIMLFATVSAGAFILPNNPYIKVSDKESYNSSIISGYYVNQDPDPAEPGGYVDLRWRIENMGEEEAENLTIEILPKYPFTLDEGQSAKKHYGSLYPGQIGEDGIILHYKLKIDEEAVEGEYDVKLRYKYNNNGWITSDDFKVRIRPHDAILSVKDVRIDPEEFAPGEKGKVILVLENNAGVLLKNIQTKLDLTEKPFTPVGSTNEKIINLLPNGEEKSLIFDLVSDANTDRKSVV